MEFDIGTLIYIIITLVAILAGTLGKKKKPGQSKPAGGSEGSGGGFLENLGKQFEGLLDEAKSSVQLTSGSEDSAEEEAVFEAEEKPVESILYQYSKSSLGEESIFSDYEGSYNIDSLENEDLIKDEAERATEGGALEIIELDETKYADYYEIIQDFDLGTAVIYSSIINRKEY